MSNLTVIASNNSTAQKLATAPLTSIKTLPRYFVNIKVNGATMQVTRECRMNKMAPHLRCKSCRKWQEHCYQEHMERERVSFFKLLTGDFVKGISIPEKFVSNLNGQITRVFNLKAPSGETWLVDVTKNADELLFKSGWDNFVRAHELQENDLVIFTRSGNCSFDVLILDSSGCEKVSCFFTTKKGPCMHKHFNGRVHEQAEHCMLSDSDDLGMPLRLVASPHRASTSKKGSKTKPRKEPESPINSNNHIKQEAMSDEEQSDEDRLADSSYYYYYSKSANILTGGERDKIFSLVSIQPGNPALVAVLLKSHVGYKNNMLTIHHGFAAEHLEGRSHEILLLRPNRKEKWHVKYYHASHTRGFNCRRWVKFVHDNRLRKDHICVFELLKGAKRTTMVVHVLRKVDGRLVLVA